MNELRGLGLRWSWGDGYGEMLHKPYGGNNDARVSCFLSHYMLWYNCTFIEKPILILEHDAVFVRPFEPFEFDSICMINDPKGATPKGDWWHDQMVKRGPGVWPKTKIFDNTRPDGLAGNSAYVIKPHAAQQLIDLVDSIGAWPNDAIMCRQLIDGLEEHYPFITEVQAEQSTIR
jgi:GR25 family glycosyltransferase involved in LPS biosynthesis